MISEVSRGVRGYWLCGPPAAAATSADSRRRALREVDRSQWTIPKVQACEQFIQAQAYSLEPDDPPESPALLCPLKCDIKILHEVAIALLFWFKGDLVYLKATLRVQALNLDNCC